MYLDHPLPLADKIKMTHRDTNLFWANYKLASAKLFGQKDVLAHEIAFTILRFCCCLHVNIFVKSMVTESNGQV